tara:strand:- start:6185 stop:6706 length:522 start_codon:yes stop_codon:yes gene_type:complete
MRIISGKHKGRKLTAPSKLPVRPTTDRAKEGLFNILENRYDLKNREVLDLFSGTGNISYEFGSRGCGKITSVDINKYCISYISKTSNNLDMNIKTVKEDCIKYLQKTNTKFDFIFLDPPYNYKKHGSIKDIIFSRGLIREGGCLIIEHNNSTIIEGKVELRKYGTVCFSIFSF